VKKTVVTSALPYANGPIHLGHMVEYIETDIYVRYLKSRGESVIYCCADDTHGAPIEINARKQGITPEDLINRSYREHQQDFHDFHVDFDSFYSTNSPENKEMSDLIFTRLRDRGDIYTKEIELTYCNQCERFLPDRYVRGTCPRCGATDQYGDNCESCNSTYQPTDLLHATCALCGSVPTTRTSVHYFFKLTNYADRLREFLTNKLIIQENIRNFCLHWIDGGLKDWDISRDAPYFGFPIVGETDKYYYVWLDAPIGYIASTKHYCEQRGLDYEDYWTRDTGRIIHFIGKDIIYFHFLFWPAMLMGAGFQLPEAIHVHGFLTVNGEKMSKSRGTFITARQYLNALNPDYLRYYYAAHLGNKVSDVDLDLEHFRQMVSGQLVDNILNLANRVLKFTASRLDGRLTAGALPPSPDRVGEILSSIQTHYAELDFSRVVRDLGELGDIGNQFIQETQPWSQIKTSEDEARTTVSRAVDLLRRMAICMSPILPTTTQRLFSQMNSPVQTLQDLDHTFSDHRIGTPEPLLPRIDKVDLISSEEGS